MSDTTYNGWRNYETWVVKLWMDNEQPSYEYWLERVEENIKSATRHGADSNDAKQDAMNALAEELKSEHEEAMPEVTGVFSDLLTAAMGEVDWYEIAEAMVNDYVSDNPEVLQEETEEAEE